MTDSKAKIKTTTKKKAKAETSVKTKNTAKKTTTVKKTATRTRKSRKTRKKVNLLKLCTEMNKMAHDAVDREIIKRFKTIIDTGEEDISKARLSLILNEPKNVELSDFHESHQPYIKHYLFMLKRDKGKK